MKKIITLALAAAMLSATGITAFAADPETKATNVSYDVQPTYTVTIPAKVDLGDNDVTAKIEASDVLLETGKKIKVDLTAASNTASGSTFNAKNGDSAVTYTITGDKAIAVGDTVATFTANGRKTLTFSAADKSAATVAGAHTETLTFGISVENAAQANPYAANNVGDVVTFGSYDWYIINKSDNGVTLLMEKSFTNKAYNDSSTDVTWETCSLRTYLNGDFYNSFSDDDRAKIVKTSNTNPNHPDYGTNGGNNTEDYIYLLSIAEANALSDTIRANSSGSRWWLRSPGYSSDYAAFVYVDGGVDTDGSSVDYGYGVRPALNLEF